MTPTDALATARLYLCTDARKRQGDFEDFVDAAFEGGVDIIQLRDKTLEAAEELELLAVLQGVAQRHGRLWAVNDRADVANVSGAPVFHIGQKDLPLTVARRLLPEPVTDRSLHPLPGAGQCGHRSLTRTGRPGLFLCWPGLGNPTKPGRDAVGLDLVTYAAEASKRADETTGGAVNLPWFAIGGIDLSNVEQVLAAGASRIVVVRAITEAADPTTAAKSLLEALDAA